MQVIITLACLIILSGLTHGAESTVSSEPTDLIPWSPPAELPKLRERLAADTYEKRRREILAELDRAALAQGSQQLFSGEVVEVSKGGQAEKVGLKKGDYILGVDDHALIPNSKFNAFRNNAEQIFHWELTSGKKKSAPLHPGLLGFKYSTDLIWRAAAMYLHSNEINGAWDDDLLVACQSMVYESDVAETALFRAHASGYRGAIGLVIAAMVSKNRLEYDATLAFGHCALQLLPIEHRVLALQPMFIAAQASGRSAMAMQLEKKFGLTPEHHISIIQDAKWSAVLSPNVRICPSPLEMAEKKSYIDLSKIIKIESNLMGWAKERMRTTQQVKLKSPTDQYQFLPFGPRVQSGILNMNIITTTPDKKIGSYSSSIKISIDSWDAKQKRLPLASLILFPNGDISIERKDTKNLNICRCFIPKEGQSFPVIAAVNDGVVEFKLGGKRAYIGPISLLKSVTNEKLIGYGCTLQVVGWGATFSAVTWRSIGLESDNEQNSAHLDFVTMAREAEKNGSPEVTIAAYQRAVAVSDWNAKKAFADYYQKNHQTDLASEWYKRWAQESMDPGAWLRWATFELTHHPEHIDVVLAELHAEVQNKTSWINDYYSMNNFFTVLRHLRRTNDALTLLLPLQQILQDEGMNTDVLVQIFYCYITTGEWAKARMIAKRLLVTDFLNPNYFVHVWTLDATLAVAMGQPAPDPDPVYQLLNRKPQRESLELSFSYFVGDIDEATALANSLTIKDGEEVLLYCGLRALALGNHQNVLTYFKKISEKYPDWIESIMARDLTNWLTDQTPDKLTALKPPPVWPYQGFPAKKRFPAKNGDKIAVPPPVGANDF